MLAMQGEARPITNSLPCRWTVVLAGLLWATGIAYAASGRAPASGQQNAGEPPPSQAPQATPPQKPARRQSGWHRFGQSTEPAAPGQRGVWRHFGANDPAPKIAPPQPAARPTTARQATTRQTTLLPRVSASRIVGLEKEMYELINRGRADPANATETGGRAGPLRWNERLAEVARAHSLSMVRQGFFDHVDPQGRDPDMRLKAAGIPWQAQGENIAVYDDVASAEAAFIDEPRFEQNHRANILSRDYTDVGIGIVQAPDGRYYVTQEFIEVPSGVRASRSGSRGAN